MPQTLLCATVTGSTMSALRAARDAQAGADLVELRLDTAETPDVGAALAGRRQPVVVTCRPTWEGGAFDGSEEVRRRILLDACASDADYVDVEHRAPFVDDVVRRRRGRGVIVSYHAFDGVPGDLRDRYRAMRATGAEIVKVAVAVRSLGEALDVMALGDRDEPRLLVGMGPAGVVTRVLAGRFGVCWTYAGTGIAPGQIDLDRMRREFAFHSITDRTAIYGVVGRPVGHSVSPAMHNAGFRAAGLDAVYLPLEAYDLGDFTRFARAVGLRGASVTAPFKEAVAACVTEADATSRAVGAVNTLRFDGGRWLGRNTDVDGFLAPFAESGGLAGTRAPFAESGGLAGTRATVLGAGGAARAVAWGLRREGATVCIAARRADRAEEVGRAVGASAVPLPPVPGSWDVLVNTTPVGTFPHIDATPLPVGPFDGQVVYDLVYNPPTTRLLRDAARAGCRTIGGLAMLVGQAVRQFDWWTGQAPSSALFREAAERELARQAGTTPRADGDEVAAARGVGRRPIET